MSHESNTFREGLRRAALEQRLSEAESMLDGERKALDWLRETNRMNAAKRVEDNIIRMTQRITKYHDEMQS